MMGVFSKKQRERGRLNSQTKRSTNVLSCPLARFLTKFMGHGL